MKKSFYGVLVIVTAVVLFFPRCKKDIAITPIVSSTPLQALINSDTSLSVFYAAVKKSGNNALYGSLDTITILLPTDAAFAAAGITAASINNRSAAWADSLLRYHFIPDTIRLVSGSYTSYNSKLGPALYGYGDFDSSGNFFNGAAATYQRLPGSNTTVYKLNALLNAPAASVVQLIAADSSLSLFAESIKHTGLSLLPASAFNSILAPVNAAFIAAGFPSPESIDNADASTLANILRYHILPGQYFSNNFDTLHSVTTAQGSIINISVVNGAIQLKGNNNIAAATMIKRNSIAGTNVILHTINTVLMP